MLATKILQAISKRNFPELIHYAFILARNAVGLDNRLITEDRAILEKTILPYYAGLPEVSKILFVGTDWFTRHYETIFQSKEYWTIDISSWKRQFAGKRHIVDSLQNLGNHFQPKYFDLIICNGVVGWGLNEKVACNEALGQCHDCLNDNGYLVLGWNDLPKYCPVPLEEIAALKLFRPVVFPGLGVVRYLANQENRHTFDFYIK